jgi:hypothetical protein
MRSCDFISLIDPLCRWLRRYATSRKVEGSGHNDVIEFLKLPDPSSRIMALGITQPLTQMSTRGSFLGVERGRQVRLTT